MSDTAEPTVPDTGELRASSGVSGTAPFVAGTGVWWVTVTGGEHNVVLWHDNHELTMKAPGITS